MTSPAAGQTGTAPSGIGPLTQTDLGSLFQYIQGRLPQPPKTAVAPSTSLPASGVEGQQAILTDSLTAPTWYLLYQWNSAAAAWVPVGDRVVDGVVDSTGATVSGTGFTPATSATGVYTVTFDVDFDVAPVPSATLDTAGLGVTIRASSTTSVLTVNTFNLSGSAVDTGFSFRASQTI